MSARRFGGRHSPHGSSHRKAGHAGATPSPPPPPPPNKFRGRAAASVDVRTILMFLFPTPLLVAAIGAIGDSAPIRLTVLLFAYACLLMGAWLLREGQKAEAAYEAREIARAPAFPRKLCAAGLAGIGVLAATWITGPTAGFLEETGRMITAVVFGALAAGAHLLAFGLDPMHSKGLGKGIAEAELDRVADALEKAEAKLKAIEGLAHRMDDREIDDRLMRLNATVRDMIAIVEKDPRDLGRARRYLGVYLKGAEEATRKYAETHEHLNDPKLREDYLSLLGDLEASFSRGRETLLLDDRTDLEVEIEVLRERLDQETR